jgi:hypothetical protein
MGLQDRLDRSQGKAGGAEQAAWLATARHRLEALRPAGTLQGLAEQRAALADLR